MKTETNLFNVLRMLFINILILEYSIFQIPPWMDFMLFIIIAKTFSCNHSIKTSDFSTECFFYIFDIFMACKVPLSMP